jgi:hypothetical protein
VDDSPDGTEEQRAGVKAAGAEGQSNLASGGSEKRTVEVTNLFSHRFVNFHENAVIDNSQSLDEEEGLPDLRARPGRRRLMVNRLHSAHWLVQFGVIIFVFRE